MEGLEGSWWLGFWTGLGLGVAAGVVALAVFALWWDRRAWKRAGRRPPTVGAR